jgi:hypothetical protein
MRWAPGDVILWCYRREALPVRVVRDDDVLAVWVAPGTQFLTALPADGRGLRDRPLEERFTCARVMALAEWFGAGVLRIASPGDFHSSWLFRKHDDHEAFWGWYGNLEAPLQRSAIGVHTQDHVLDVWCDEHGVHWKDEDELEAAVATGRFTAAQASDFRAHGEKVFAAMQSGEPPYDGSWLDWRPDPSWSLPELPDEFRALVGRPAFDLFPDLLP